MNSSLRVLKLLLGNLSIACWIAVFTPQIYTNYQNKSGEGLSVPFLIIWLVGDVFCVAGLALNNRAELFQLVLACYYTVVDAALIAQIYFYRRQYHYSTVADADSVISASETVQSLTPWFRSICISFFTHSAQAASFISVVLTRKNDSSLYFSAHNDTINQVSDICGWISAILYIGSRLPQLWKNFRLKSCEGLSMWLFFLSFFGNVFYVLSIVCKYLDENCDSDVIVTNAPYIVGSGGTLLFDLLIFLQFFSYRDVKENESDIEPLLEEK